ncbi:hypothetical protein J1614_002796 [Plenodomus biglobosus]|nr:hypothetical protein J1614_002796 [Plenodomus biglobosus]
MEDTKHIIFNVKRMANLAKMSSSDEPQLKTVSAAERLPVLQASKATSCSKPPKQMAGCCRVSQEPQEGGAQINHHGGLGAYHYGKCAWADGAVSKRCAKLLGRVQP